AAGTQDALGGVPLQREGRVSRWLYLAGRLEMLKGPGPVLLLEGDLVCVVPCVRPVAVTGGGGGQGLEILLRCREVAPNPRQLTQVAQQRGELASLLGGQSAEGFAQLPDLLALGVVAVGEAVTAVERPTPELMKLEEAVHAGLERGHLVDDSVHFAGE